MLSPGQLIDQYVVEAELGRGGMAVVYRVRNTALDNLFALKVLTSTRDDVRQRMIREGRVQANLRHRNIVRVYNVIDVLGSPGLLMDLVDGPDLRTWLAAGEGDLETRIEIFDQVLRGVAHAHRSGVVHRDLKPANVLLSLEDEDWVPKVTDFGLVKVLEGELSSDLVETRTRMRMGTPVYMAPEQFRQARDVDARADIWALGCMLYVMVTGRRPFDGESELDVWQKVSAGTYIPASDLVDELPDEIEQAIQGCLQPDRDERIPSVPKLRRMLEGQTRFFSRPPPTDEMPVIDQPSDLPADTYAEWVAEQEALAQAVEAPRVAPPPPPVRAADPLPPADSHASLEPAPTPESRPAAGRRLAPWLGVAALLGLLAVAAGALGLAMLGQRSGATAEPAPVEAAPAPQEAAPEAPPEEGVDTAPEPEALPRPSAERAASDARAARAAAEARAAVAPEPVAAPAPEAAPAPASWAVEGDVDKVYLRDADGRRHPPGELPAGAYTLQANFGTGYRDLQTVEVSAGETVRFTCHLGFSTCTR